MTFMCFYFSLPPSQSEETGQGEGGPWAYHGHAAGETPVRGRKLYAFSSCYLFCLQQKEAVWREISSEKDYCEAPG